MKKRRQNTWSNKRSNFQRSYAAKQSINHTHSQHWDNGHDQKYDQNTFSEPLDMGMEWSWKCMITNTKTVLFTDESRASPRDPDGITKGWFSTVIIFHNHFMRKSLFPEVREGILVILLIEATIPMSWLRVVYTLFCSLASLKITPLVVPGILSKLYSID